MPLKNLKDQTAEILTTEGLEAFERSGRAVAGIRLCGFGLDFLDMNAGLCRGIFTAMFTTTESLFRAQSVIRREIY